jgi:hypothetical protein
LANYNSIPQQFNKPRPNANLGYIDQVLSEKQSTIDANFSFLSKGVEKILGTELIGKERKEYLKNKLSGVLDTLENVDSVSFDSSRASVSFAAALSSAARDPYVQKHTMIAKEIRNAKEFADKRKEKGTLNSGNYNDAWIQSKYADYITGTDAQGNKVDEVGKFQYVEYRDVDDKVRKALKEFKDLQGSDMYSFKDNNGYVYEKRVDLLTEGELQQILPGVLDGQDRAQLAINGRIIYNYDNAKAEEDLQIEEDGIISANTAKIESLKADLNNLDDDKKELANSEITRLVAMNKQIGVNYDNMPKTAGAIGGRKLESQMFSKYAAVFGEKPYVSLVGSDVSYWKQKEIEEKEGVGTGSGGMDSNISSEPIPQNLTDDKTLNLDKRFDESIKQSEAKISSIANKVYTLAKSKGLDDEIDVIKQKYIGQGMNEKDALIKTIADVSNWSNQSVMTLDDKDELLKSIYDASNKREKRNTAYKFASDAIVNDNLKTIMDDLVNDHQFMILHTKKGEKHVEENFQEVFKKNNVDSEESLKKFLSSGNQDSKNVKANILIQAADFTTSTEKGFKAMSSESLVRYKAAAKLMGADVSKIQVSIAKGLFSRSSNTGNLSDVSAGDYVKFMGSDAFSTTVKKTSISDFPGGFYGDPVAIDMNFRTDSGLSEAFSDDNFKKHYDGIMTNQMAKISGLDAISIRPTILNSKPSLVFGEIGDIITPTPEARLWDIKQAITLVDIGNDQFMWKQPIPLNAGKGDDKEEQRTGKISRSSLLKKPLFSKFVNANAQEKEMTFQMDSKIESGSINYMDATVPNAREAINKLKGLAPYATKDFYKDYISKDKELSPEFKTFAQKIISSSNRFMTRFESAETSQGGIASVQIFADNQKEPVYKINVENINQMESYAMVQRVAPQVFLSLMMENMVVDFKNRDVEEITRLQNILNGAAKR